MNIQDLFNKLTSRKLLVTLALSLIATICLFIKIATFDQWADMSKWLLGLYSCGNIGEYLSKKSTAPTV